MKKEKAKRLARFLGSILGGMIFWAFFWNMGTTSAQFLFPEILRPEEPLFHLGALWGLIAFSVVLSLVAGFITATLEKGRPIQAVFFLAGVQFILGVIAEVSYWDLMPVWYHIVFLGCVVPATLGGGYLKGKTTQQKPKAA